MLIDQIIIPEFVYIFFSCCIVHGIIGSDMDHGIFYAVFFIPCGSVVPFVARWIQQYGDYG